MPASPTAGGMEIEAVVLVWVVAVSVVEMTEVGVIEPESEAGTVVGGAVSVGTDSVGVVSTVE